MRWGGWDVAEPSGFREFVAGRGPALSRSAWLLTGDAHMAEDLLQAALMKAWLHWDRVLRADSPEAYVRRTMYTTYVSWWRRRWRGEAPTDRLPEQPDPVDQTDTADLRDAVGRMLATLPPGQRAVVVLRYYDDYTEAQAADVLGCSVGTIKSQTSRALAALRNSPLLPGLVREGP